jgi:hypothetical protein
VVNDWDKVSLAFDVLENADVMEEFEDYLWIRVNREDWEKLMGGESCAHAFETDSVMINVCTKCGVEGNEA